MLGAIRVLLIVPRFGTRTAELMETPIMVLVSILAARWVVRRLAVPPALATRLAIGLVALLVLLTEHSPTRVRYWEVDDHCFISASVAVVV